MVDDLDIGTLTPDDLDAFSELRALGFGGPARPIPVDAVVTPLDQVVVARRGGRLLAAVAAISFRQWFGGRPVPCAGVAGVLVAPPARGEGLARRLLGEAATAARRRGEVVAALYPTTAPLYRSLGWEVAGWWDQVAVPTASLPAPSGAVEWEPVAHDDAALRDVHDRGAAGRDGWIVPPEGWWRARAARIAQDTGPVWSWLGRRGGEAVAAVGYRHRSSDRALYDLQVDLVAGVDGAALDDALAFLGGHGTTTDRVVTTLPRRVLARHVDGSSLLRSVAGWPWMLRVLDLPGAVAARGWPPGLHLEVALDVVPARVPDPGGPAGPHLLQVADGAATCTPGGPGTVRVGVGDLASVLAGGVDPAALAAEGRIAGADAATLAGLRAACAGDPSLPWFF